MPIEARYGHTSITAKDWRALVRFYVDVFGCEPIGSQREHRGEWVGRVAGVPGAAIDGIHLKLPGFDGSDHFPTIEIFQYHEPEDRPSPPAANRLGFSHIAFQVDDVEAARTQVLANGGQDVGDVVTREVPDAGTITLVYMTDPEGNIIELQRWS